MVAPTASTLLTSRNGFHSPFSVMPNLENEISLFDLYKVPVMGIDEAGRGPLAGPVFAAAVSLPIELAEELASSSWASVNDSKKLSEKKRNELAEMIRATPGCLFAIAYASPREIDHFNILRATHLAMKRAALSLAEQIPPTTAPTPHPASILVDGLPVPSLPFPSQNLVKGDRKSLFIAAASILAKTARDANCLELDKQYPGYGFAQHKGYPTQAHLEALNRLGPCPEHRFSFAPVSEQSLFPNL